MAAIDSEECSVVRKQHEQKVGEKNASKAKLKYTNPSARFNTEYVYVVGNCVLDVGTDNVPMQGPLEVLSGKNVNDDKLMLVGGRRADTRNAHEREDNE